MLKFTFLFSKFWIFRMADFRWLSLWLQRIDQKRETLYSMIISKFRIFEISIPSLFEMLKYLISFGVLLLERKKKTYLRSEVNDNFTFPQKGTYPMIILKKINNCNQTYEINFLHPKMPRDWYLNGNWFFPNRLLVNELALFICNKKSCMSFISYYT